MLNFQEMIAKLLQFWAKQGCVVHQGYDLEVGAGTFNPATFLRCLGPEPYAAVYVEPSRRPQDGRYGENPNRVQFYHQMQVIMKPSPLHIQELYLKSLETIGLQLNDHDIRFVHDDWENPTIGAWGLGWEVWADGMEVSQFTYFQAVGGIPVHPVTGEITYGLERLAMYIQGVNSMFDLRWNDEITYGDVFKRSEYEWSHYNFSEADTAMWFRHFEDFETEAKRLIRNHFPIPAYDFVMKSSHAFNLLDARGVISVTERTGYIARIRALAKLLAESWIQSRETLQFPLLRNQKKKEKPSILDLSAKSNPEGRHDFLFEIGSEELPATFVPIGLQNLEHQMRALLNDRALSFEKIDTYGTPRRLAVCVYGLAGGTQSRQIERKGPPLSAAFDIDGHPTKVGSGFFRSLNLESPTLTEIEKKMIPSIEIKKVKEIPYLFAMIEEPGISTRELFSQSLKDLILSIDFPKKMRWSDCDIEYARPLRWVVALYGSEVIPFTIGDVVASNFSYGHRQLAPQKIEIQDPKEYLNTLRKHWVIASVHERNQEIEKQLKEIETSVKGEAVAKERVMPQVLHLVEYPFLTIADFDKQFLQAPKEVLISEMVEHQKYFPIANQKGELMPHFVIVCNNKATDLIRLGNQRALSPRLADGMFLYEEDLKVSLDHLNEKLKTVTFQKDIGSVWEKVQRLVALTEMLHAYLPICDLSTLQRAAALCKADLASHLVGEFPELQGTVGKLYALNQKELSEVACAIEEHWMPRGEKASLPRTHCGLLLSLAEKLDNFLSCYSLDLKPTSSSDPYALRRQAIGFLKMLIEGKHHLPLAKVFKAALEIFLKTPALSHKLAKEIHDRKESIVNDIVAYFTNRFRTLLHDCQFEKDEVEAVLSHGLYDAYDILRKLKALHEFRVQHADQFAALLEIYTRAKKILLSQHPELLPSWVRQHQEIKNLPQRHVIVNPELFKHSIETEVYQKMQTIKKSFHTELIDRREIKGRLWLKAFLLFVELQKPLNQLFESVKIIDDDLTTRNNRLALLHEIWDLSEELADFSKIQEHAHV